MKPREKERMKGQTKNKPLKEGSLTHHHPLPTKKKKKKKTQAPKTLEVFLLGGLCNYVTY